MGYSVQYVIANFGILSRSFGIGKLGNRFKCEYQILFRVGFGWRGKFPNSASVERTGLEPVTSALSKQRSEPTELTFLNAPLYDLIYPLLPVRCSYFNIVIRISFHHAFVLMSFEKNFPVLPMMLMCKILHLHI